VTVDDIIRLLRGINPGQDAAEIEAFIVEWARSLGYTAAESQDGAILPTGRVVTFGDPVVDAIISEISRIIAYSIELSTDLKARTTTIRILRRVSTILAHHRPGREEMELVEKTLAEELGTEGLILTWQGEDAIVLYHPKSVKPAHAKKIAQGIPPESGIYQIKGKPNGIAIVTNAEDGIYKVILLGDIHVDPDLLRLLSAVMIPEMRSIVLDHTASTDNLTGLLRRERLMALLKSLWQFAKTSGIPMGLIMIDIDHFKRVNDTYGHHVGDQVLRHVASLIRVMTPRMSLVGRYGGEEFLVVVADARMDELIKIAEAIRLAVAETPAQTDAGEISVTVSLGIHLADPRRETPKEAIKKADEAMYKAKAGGRNRVEVL